MPIRDDVRGWRRTLLPFATNTALLQSAIAATVLGCPSDLSGVPWRRV
jgi:hypothetical protein